jgi:hypothetical protein
VEIASRSGIGDMGERSPTVSHLFVNDDHKLADVTVRNAMGMIATLEPPRAIGSGTLAGPLGLLAMIYWSAMS